MRSPTRSRTTVAVGALGAGLVTVLAACGANPASADDAITLRFAHVYDAQHPVEACGFTTAHDALEGSGIRLESYPSAQLGTEAEMLEQVAAGGLDVAVAGPSFLGVWHQPAEVLDAAYLFEDVDHFTETVEGEAVAQIHDDLFAKSGIKVMSTWYYGTRHVTGDRPVRAPEDLQGVKIRTPDAPLYLRNIAAMGGTATPMALDEVYTALQQGTLDAQENPIPTIASSRLYEVQDYISLTGHMVQAVHVVTHDGILELLTPEQQSRLDAAMAAGARAIRECVEQQEAEVLQQWKDDGSITVIEDVDREAFARAAREEVPRGVPWGELYVDIQERAGR